LGIADWAKIQDQMAQMMISMGAPHDLMMFSIDTDDVGKQDIYIGLPSKPMLSAFPGFSQVMRENLPEFMSTLVVREDGFKEAFPDIAAKRNASDKRRH
jgi:hypothetical protein